MPDTLLWIASQFAGRLAAAVQALTGNEASVDARRVSSARPRPGDFLWREQSSSSPASALWICIPEALWRGAGRMVLAAAGIDDAGDEDARGAFIELLQQSTGPLAQLFSSRMNREVALGPGAEVQAHEEDAEWIAVPLSAGGSTWPPILLSASKSLLDELQPPQPVAEDRPASTLPVPASASGASKVIDLLMEVELPVSVSFGRTRMRLKEAVKLTTGSIVELNRSIVEPVEVIVNNCVIARGEVVVVEGNYGVRIRQIVSREERLRTLF